MRRRLAGVTLPLLAARGYSMRLTGAVSFSITFTATWDDMTDWWTHYDPSVVGPALTEEQWTRFEQAVAGTVAFADAARTARKIDAETVDHIA